MKAMILAAGRGERMRPLTDELPKPMLVVGGKPLIVHHIERLAEVGVTDIVINIAYLGDIIRSSLGNGEHWNVSIQYSEEPEPLETAGALLHALPLLEDSPFLLLNADVWTDFELSLLLEQPLGESLGRLVFVDNPKHNPAGDFSLVESELNDQGLCVSLKQSDQSTYTFSGIGLFSPDIISTYPHKRSIFPLREVFQHCIQQQQLSALVYHGQWWDIGTPERLSALNDILLDNSHD